MEIDDPDGDIEAEESGPLRKCCATGARHPVERMIRFVRSPDGEAVPDLAQSLPGRGVWVHADAASLDKAARGVCPADSRGLSPERLRRHCLRGTGNNAGFMRIRPELQKLIDEAGATAKA